MLKTDFGYIKTTKQEELSKKRVELHTVQAEVDAQHQMTTDRSQRARRLGRRVGKMKETFTAIIQNIKDQRKVQKGLAQEYARALNPDTVENTTQTPPFTRNQSHQTPVWKYCRQR